MTEDVSEDTKFLLAGVCCLGLECKLQTWFSAGKDSRRWGGWGWERLSKISWGCSFSQRLLQKAWSWPSFSSWPLLRFSTRHTRETFLLAKLLRHGWVHVCNYGLIGALSQLYQSRRGCGSLRKAGGGRKLQWKNVGKLQASMCVPQPLPKECALSLSDCIRL